MRPRCPSVPNRADDEHAPTPTNSQRAEAAYRALHTFAQREGMSTHTNDMETVVGDFLASLAHYCDEMGISLQERLSNARMHYDAETRARGEQFNDLSLAAAPISYHQRRER